MSESTTKNENKIEKESEMFVRVHKITIDPNINGQFLVDVEITDYFLILKNILVETSSYDPSIRISLPEVWTPESGERFEPISFPVRLHKKKIFSEIFRFMKNNNLLTSLIHNGWRDDDD